MLGGDIGSVAARRLLLTRSSASASRTTSERDPWCSMSSAWPRMSSAVRLGAGRRGRACGCRRVGRHVLIDAGNRCRTIAAGCGRPVRNPGQAVGLTPSRKNTYAAQHNPGGHNEYEPTAPRKAPALMGTIFDNHGKAMYHPSDVDENHCR